MLPRLFQRRDCNVDWPTRSADASAEPSQKGKKRRPDQLFPTRIMARPALLVMLMLSPAVVAGTTVAVYAQVRPAC